MDASLLDSRKSNFGTTMKANVMWALEKPMTKNPMLEVWQKLGLNMVESVEDKRLFNDLSFISPSSVVI